VFFRALDLAGDVRVIEPAESFFAAYADRSRTTSRRWWAR
jgi:hypothetical protein